MLDGKIIYPGDGGCIAGADGLVVRELDGRLACAAFDVLATKQPDDRELLKLPNFIATPHLDGSAEEAILAMDRAAIDGLENNQIPERGVFPDNY